MMSWIEVLKTASCRNVRKDSIHKAQNSWTLP
jgi:hypothetical protein